MSACSLDFDLELQPTKLSFQELSLVAGALVAPAALSHRSGLEDPNMDADEGALTGADGVMRPLIQIVVGAVNARGGSGGAPQAARVVELYRGLSNTTALPAGMDLIVHEILGNVASAEGVINAINELRGREGLAGRTCLVLGSRPECFWRSLSACFSQLLLSSGACRVLPEAAGTLLAPTSAVNMCIVERLLMFENTGRSAPKPHKLYAVRGFPAEHMLAAPQPMEWLEFNEYMPPVSTRVVTFETVCAGGFEGLHMHLQVRTADCH